MKDRSILWNKVARLTREQPQFRAQLLPLLKKAAEASLESLSEYRDAHLKALNKFQQKKEDLKAKYKKDTYDLLHKEPAGPETTRKAKALLRQSKIDQLQAQQDSYVDLAEVGTNFQKNVLKILDAKSGADWTRKGGGVWTFLGKKDGKTFLLDLTPAIRDVRSSDCHFQPEGGKAKILEWDSVEILAKLIKNLMSFDVGVDKIYT